MARNDDRHFSESDGLNAREMGASAPDAEERLPAWARDMEEAEEENAPASGQEDKAPGGEDGPEAASERQKADEAWAREAKRVEGGQYRRRPLPNGVEEPAPAGKSAKAGKKPGKGARKKGGKKKTASQAEERRNIVKIAAIVAVCGVLFVMVAMMILSSFISSPLLTLPRRLVTAVITPLQSVFSGMTDSVVNYLRTLKIRGNLEYEYEQLLIQLDSMANDTARMQELIHENEALWSILDEQEGNRDLNGLFAQVIGTEGGNYFSTLTLNVGTANQVTDYMAVVHNGGLVGVTYNTKEYTCNVRCIINSDCTVAGLVQSNRDQGSVKGTLGTNGEPMCRMYYLPDNSLPRPGDLVVTSGVGLEFPKGIPIGNIRESTRGMEDNKSYVVLEPVVDFQHLEYVTVYRYRPSYAEDAQSRSNAAQNIVLEPLATARPIPSFEMEGLSDFIYNATASPTPEATETPAPTPGPGVTATPETNATTPPDNLEYHITDRSGATATPSPRPTFTPTPSPEPTPDAGAMTVEDDE